MFIMNFKEIHSNMEFLSTYRRAMACSCRNKIKNAFIEKWLENSFKEKNGTFFVFLWGRNIVQLPHAKNQKYNTFSTFSSV